LPVGQIDWNLFLSKHHLPVRAPAAKTRARWSVFNTMTQPGYRIDTKLVDPLAMLPPNIAKAWPHGGRHPGTGLPQFDSEQRVRAAVRAERRDRATTCSPSARRSGFESSKKPSNRRKGGLERDKKAATA
jgi:hypothetical protein